MANKVDTRIRHKHDTEENWLKATNFVPLLGELIVYDPDASHSFARVKMGDGVNVVSALPFLGDTNSIVIEGGADATASQKIMDALGEDGRYIIEFTEDESEYSLVKPFYVPITNNWTAEGDYFYQDIEVRGMLELYSPICDYEFSTDMAVNVQVQEAWSNIISVETYDERIRVWASSIPEIDFTIRLSVFAVSLADYATAEEKAY